jgi:hypothetical protein
MPPDLITHEHPRFEHETILPPPTADVVSSDDGNDITLSAAAHPMQPPPSGIGSVTQRRFACRYLLIAIEMPALSEGESEPTPTPAV